MSFLSSPLDKVRLRLNQLLEGAVDGRADFVSLVKVNRRHGALADAFGRELEFLR